MKIQFRSVKGVRSKWFRCPSDTIAYASGLWFRAWPPRLSREFEQRGFCCEFVQDCESGPDEFARLVRWESGNSLSDWWVVVS